MTSEVALTVARVSTPLVFAALGGYLSERSGVINIALEGLMLAGAFTSAIAAGFTHSAWLGLGAGVMGAVLLGTVHAFLTISCRANAIISGLAVNALAAGITPVACKALFDSSTSSPMLEGSQKIAPLLGSLSPITLAAPLAALILYLVHTRTRFGQHLRFAGETPEALDGQGVSASRTRWAAVLLGSAFCGIAGSYLAIDHGSGFTRNMTAGRGFVALAAVIVGRWSPQGAFIGALVFGTIETCQILFQNVEIFPGKAIPVQWMQCLPFLATLAVLALVNARSKVSKPFVPKALSS